MRAAASTLQNIGRGISKSRSHFGRNVKLVLLKNTSRAAQAANLGVVTFSDVTLAAGKRKSSTPE
jgi:hypothetical protein